MQLKILNINPSGLTTGLSDLRIGSGVFVVAPFFFVDSFWGALWPDFGPFWDGSWPNICRQNIREKPK